MFYCIFFLIYRYYSLNTFKKEGQFYPVAFHPSENIIAVIEAANAVQLYNIGWCYICSIKLVCFVTDINIVN